MQCEPPAHRLRGLYNADSYSDVDSPTNLLPSSLSDIPLTTEAMLFADSQPEEFYFDPTILDYIQTTLYVSRFTLILIGMLNSL